MAALAAALLLASVLAGAAYLLARDRQATLDAITTVQSNIVLGLERDIARNIDIYDLSLRAMASGRRLMDGAQDRAAQDAILFDGARAARYFRSVLIADETGRVLQDAGAPVPRVASVADREFFLQHQAQDGIGLLVRLSGRSLIDGRPYLSLSRRVNRPDGSFAGTVAGGLNLDYFGDILSQFALPAGAALALVGYDGRLVAGFPFREDAAGKDISRAGLVQRARELENGTFETTSVLDGVTRIATVRRLERLPYFLAVGTPRDTVYAEWKVRAWSVGAGAVGLVGISSSLLWLVWRELAKRRSAERAARASEARLETYIDHLADGILAIGRRADGAFAYERINAAAERMLAVRSTDIIGRQPRDVWPAPIAAFAEAKWQECLEATEPLRYELVYEPPEGRRVLRFVLAPVRDSTGNGPGNGPGNSPGNSKDNGPGPVVLLLASLRDVTATVDMEARLRQAQRMEAVGQLTAGVAHDFNNMLQAQLGALELLLDEVADRPRALECAQLALAAGERGSCLTHSLLSFSRQQHLAPRAVPIDALLDGLRQMLLRTLGPRVDLHVHAERGMAPPFADMAQLEAALLNLALNARDAMPGGGRLTIEARAGAAGAAPDGLQAGGSVLLSVCDTGTGMAPEVVARACEPFFTTKGVGKGSGLGLSMVQGFVQQSGGTIRILSAPGEGTRVELWLPAAAGAAPAPGHAIPEPPRWKSRQARILLVDDVPDVLAVTAELLEAAGYDVVQAAHGIEALSLLETERPFDVLVTDYMMPGIDGGELVRRARSQSPALPALVITGFAEADVLDALPPDVDVIRKPLRGTALAQRVSEVLERVPGVRPAGGVSGVR